MTVIGFILLLVVAFVLSFAITSGVLWLICWAFGLVFSWKIAFGVWLVLLLLSSFLKGNNSSN